LIWDVVNAKQPKLIKVYRNDNGYDVMTKEVTRGKLEACCQIACFVIPSM
jgi:hypothetical protein